MPLDQIILLMAIAGSASFTPGPNNALLASSGVANGLRATVPQIFGITTGFPLMIFCVGLFLGEIFQQSSGIQIGIQILGVTILLWMAWRTATADVSSVSSGRKPLTFWQSFWFQWVNPKGWTFAIGVTAQFVDPERPVLTAAVCGFAFMIVGLGSGFTWTLAGQAMTRFLVTETRRRAFNVAMGVLIALSVVLLFVA